jgi:hypothetical protein
MICVWVARTSYRSHAGYLPARSGTLRTREHSRAQGKNTDRCRSRRDHRLGRGARQDLVNRACRERELNQGTCCFLDVPPESADPSCRPMRRLSSTGTLVTAHTTAAATGRRSHHMFPARLVSEGGKIKLFRESLNIITFLRNRKLLLGSNDFDKVSVATQHVIVR